MSQDPPTLSIVVPAYNEEEVLPQFHARLSTALVGIGLTWEVVYVNDGSKDATLPVMLGLQAGIRAFPFSISAAISARKSRSPPGSTTPAGRKRWW